MMAPRAEALHAAIAGLTNAGKSSLMNAIFSREVALVSALAGTTTDPVTKSIELAGAGPVALTDTAGLDDAGVLGPERVRRTLERLADCDILIVATRLDAPPRTEETALAERFKASGRPVVVAATFADAAFRDPAKQEWLASWPWVEVDCLSGRGVHEFKELLIRAATEAEREVGPLEGLVGAGDHVLLVTPIDTGAPKGRLILPQVETIRDALDRGCTVSLARETEVGTAYAHMKERPSLVVTDSQAFRAVAAAIPVDQPLTGFSVLFARKKGDIALLSAGLSALDRWKGPGRVLIVESCSHHRQADDIGTVKLPRIIRERLHSMAEVDFAKGWESGRDYSRYGLAVFCGGCMRTRRQAMEMTARIAAYGVPVTNYGLFLAWANGLIPRALEPLRVLEKLSRPTAVA